MISCNEFYHLLENKGIGFFTGVPDSLLKDFNAYLLDNVNKKNHIIAANEGGAIALATGHYLATGKIPLVYLQNSGQGNTINPLTSLADKEVYSIPILMLIGWRGEPGIKDEPQHKKQGRITLDLLDTLEIPYSILPSNLAEAQIVLEKALSFMQSNKMPYALVVRKDTFDKYKIHNEINDKYSLSREEALKTVMDKLGKEDITVSTTGMLSRELFEYRESQGQDNSKDFLTVGSMGHSSQIALGIALSKPDKKVYCLDGDGAAIMHLGSFAIIGSNSPKNFKHVIFNNGAHDSVGGQPTAGFNMNFTKIAEACGYRRCWIATNLEELEEGVENLELEEGPCLLEIRVKKGSRDNLGRPTRTPIENKEDFMEFLKR